MGNLLTSNRTRQWQIDTRQGKALEERTHIQGRESARLLLDTSMLNYTWYSAKIDMYVVVIIWQVKRKMTSHCSWTPPPPSHTNKLPVSQTKRKELNRRREIVHLALLSDVVIDKWASWWLNMAFRMLQWVRGSNSEWDTFSRSSCRK